MSRNSTRGLACCFWIAALSASIAGGPVAGFNTTTPYLIYYGNWDSTKVNNARNNYKVVILHPSSNVTAANVATIRRGPDNVLGTSDDVLVFAYISVGEDDRPGVPFTGDGQGPRVDPRASDNDPLSGITNVLGAPSPGGTGYASYYLDTKASPNGVPDQNSIFGGYYVNPGDPAWRNILKTMTKLSNGRAGLDEILTATNGVSYDCDGLFLDTLDTCAPNSFGGTTYEWTAPGMQSLVQWISTNYPTKLMLGNRGLFFYHPNFKTYAYTLRPYLNMVMFESYFTDSSNSGSSNAFFLDNKYNFAPKLNAEAGRPDGFNMIALGYTSTPPQPAAIDAQDYDECMRIQGWPLYRTDPSISSAFNTAASTWLSTNADTNPPVWDSTAAQSPVPPTPRVGVQQVIAGTNSATVRWDVARDQTWPVRYNLYFTTDSVLNFATATKLTHVSPELPANYALGAGSGSYAYEYTVTGLSNGVTYRFAVRAEDSAVPAHEDTNSVTIAATIGGGGGGYTSYRTISIDGDFSDWAGTPVLATAAYNNPTLSFASLNIVNDSDYLYLRFTLHGAALPFSDFNTHVFIDTDNNAATGYAPPGISIGSELLIESGAGYDERNGSYNNGTVIGLGWLLSPSGSGTNFEVRISRQALFSTGGANVFSNNTIRLALQDNRGSIMTTQGVPYTFAQPSPYAAWKALHFTPAELANPAISGDGADASGDGIANRVKYAFDLNPKVFNDPVLPAGSVTNLSGTNFFCVTYPQRNPPTDVQYLPQLSTNLANWDSSASNFTMAGTQPSSNDMAIITLRLQTPLQTSATSYVRIGIQ